MKFVLDASIGFKWFLVEDESPRARVLRDDFRMGTVELLAPDVFPVEIIHALTRAERMKRITPQEGAQLVSDLFEILPALHPSLPLLPRAYEISSQARIGVFDCLYVALAEVEQCQVVSVDARMLELFPDRVIAISSL